MSSRFIIGPLVYANETVYTGTGNVTVVNESVYVVKKGTGAATQVTLPNVLFTGQTVLIKDGKGDAATNNITVVPDGATATTIDGASSKVIRANYGFTLLNYNGTEWGTVAQGVLPSQNPNFSPAFSTLQQLPVTAATVTLNTVGENVICDCTAGSTTATVLAPGTYDGQVLTLVNQNISNSIGFNGTDATARLGDASITFVRKRKAMRFIWNATNALWYAISPGT